MAFCSCKDLLKFSGVEVVCNSCYGKDEAHISDPVVYYSLKSSGICICSAVSSANEQERYDSYAFSADEDLEEVVRCD